MSIFLSYAFRKFQSRTCTFTSGAYCAEGRPENRGRLNEQAKWAAISPTLPVRKLQQPY